MMTEIPAINYRRSVHNNLIRRADVKMTALPGLIRAPMQGEVGDTGKRPKGGMLRHVERMMDGFKWPQCEVEYL